jgi:CheY-like chemotaxis protein
VNLVMAQRLARRVCPACGATADQADETVKALRVPAKHPGYRRGEGCPACRHSGYAGRVGIYEVVPMVGAIGRLIESGAPESSMRQQARMEGFDTLIQDAMNKLNAGMTTGEELLRVIQVNAEDVRCGACGKGFSEGQLVCPYCGASTSAPAAAGPAPKAETAASPAAMPTARERSYKALVVDDNADIRTIVAAVLQAANLGLKVVTAQDGFEALDLAGTERPDIVILDISMPDMDGFEVCRQLRADPKTAATPVLMLTANDGETHVTQGFGVGADDYVVKPFRREELVARVRRMLERAYGMDYVRPRRKREAAADETAQGEPRPR